MAVAENEIDEVLLWPDKDDSGVGQRFMGHVGKQIVKAGGPPVRIIDWEVPAQIAEDAKGPGGADWAKAGQKPSLPDLIDAAEPWEPPRPGTSAEKRCPCVRTTWRREQQEQQEQQSHH